jgi:hypothetical protein
VPAVRAMVIAADGVDPDYGGRRLRSWLGSSPRRGRLLRLRTRDPWVRESDCEKRRR